MNSTIVILICSACFVLGIVLEREILHECPVIHPTANIQRALYKEGLLPYEGIDGIYGEQTRTAIDRYFKGEANKSAIEIFKKAGQQ